ncbi:hypothetical protein [Pelagerythrobacter sp.]|uniref:hypothetical protein n=1 Tax=Pelagerythrobacter sp. TaxID=2800702 RepID=UPI0035B09400
MGIHHFITFASEAEIAGLWGLLLVAVSLIAMIGETRRMKRARIDGIGWVPWRPIFLTTAIVGCGLIMLAVKGVLTG